ncbi:hypothetical protein B0H21DRAFT_828380, partial [Amylocystis lapponica]
VDEAAAEIVVDERELQVQALPGYIEGISKHIEKETGWRGYHFMGGIDGDGEIQGTWTGRGRDTEGRTWPQRLCQEMHISEQRLQTMFTRWLEDIYNPAGPQPQIAGPSTEKLPPESESEYEHTPTTGVHTPNSGDEVEATLDERSDNAASPRNESDGSASESSSGKSSSPTRAPKRPADVKGKQPMSLLRLTNVMGHLAASQAKDSQFLATTRTSTSVQACTSQSGAPGARVHEDAREGPAKAIAGRTLDMSAPRDGSVDRDVSKLGQVNAGRDVNTATAVTHTSKVSRVVGGAAASAAPEAVNTAVAARPASVASTAASTVTGATSIQPGRPRRHRNPSARAARDDPLETMAEKHKRILATSAAEERSSAAKRAPDGPSTPEKARSAKRGRGAKRR